MNLVTHDDLHSAGTIDYEQFQKSMQRAAHLMDAAVKSTNTAHACDCVCSAAERYRIAAASLIATAEAIETYAKEIK